jgi:uroporphyrinogen-III synthase
MPGQTAPRPGRSEQGRVPPLAGFTVAVTAARRADELSALLERRGAAVLRGAALRIVPLPDDSELHSVTEALVADPPDVVVATTGIGFRGWVEAAEGWGLGDQLLGRLRKAGLLARGPKARGAIRAAGLVEEWSPASESSVEVLERLLEQGVGAGIAVQRHGAPLPDFTESLRAAGAEVVPVPVYRWMPPTDPAPLDRVLDGCCSGAVDAVTFTSAPAVAGLLARAEERGLTARLLEVLGSAEVLPVCVGPVTAGPLDELGIDSLQPGRGRLGSMVQSLCTELPGRAQRFSVGGRRLEIRGQAAVLDGELRPLPPAAMALLRSLARKPGWVVSRADLLRVLPGAGGDEHAVETAMARLRSALGEPGLVRTVVKRGYRLAVDPDDPAQEEADGCLSRVPEL